MRDFFMTSARIGFSKWKSQDLSLAVLLWGDQDVTRYICASGKLTEEEILERLKTEINNDKAYGVQYWPIFQLSTGELIGCCGIRPFKSEPNSYEIGFHLLKRFWGAGYASEAARWVMEYCFTVLKADKLYAGHHPDNQASKKLLTKLGFQYIGKNFYDPTGLYHPSYVLARQEAAHCS